MFKIVVFVPAEYVEAVKQAMFDAGAGKMFGYDHCCWQTEGMGQFRPGAGANPTLGEVGAVEQVPETRP